MATTLDTPPYPEDDKLGPLGKHASVLHHHGDLRGALLTAFTSATDAARAAATEVDAGAASAVHEYRKALRRARAVLSMIGDALPKSERRAVTSAIRDARRAVSTARDQTVAPEAMAHLALGEAERSTANAVLANAAEAMAPIAEIKHLLAEGAARAAAQAEALQAALPATIAWKSVAHGVAAVYADARKARKTAKKSRSAFHAWRRRAKELTYQLEWLAGHAGERIDAQRRELEAVTDALSPAVDLIMLREFVRTHAQGVAPEALEHLITAIDAELGDQMKTGRRASKHAFARPTSTFTKRLSRAVKKDLRPPSDDDDKASKHDADDGADEPAEEAAKAPDGDAGHDET